MFQSIQKPLLAAEDTEPELQVALHPLVLLAISDYITRHALRSHTGPIVLGLIGQKTTSKIILEHAFDAHLINTKSNVYILDQEWFRNRLQQMTLVHANRQLTLVGWAAVLPLSEPQPFVLPIHHQILTHANDTAAIFLAFHSELLTSPTGSTKLPLTIYRGGYSAGAAAAQPDDTVDENGDHTMKDSTDDSTAALNVCNIRFSEVQYTIETGQAEMIALDSAIRSAGPAICEVTGGAQNATKPRESAAKGVRVEGKMRIVNAETCESMGTIAAPSTSAESTLLSHEEALIEALTTRANAIKMLRSKVQVLLAYLNQLPVDLLQGKTPSRENKHAQTQQSDKGTVGQSEGNSSMTTQDGDSMSISPDYTILRSIQAIVNCLPLIMDNDNEAFNTEYFQERQQVKLMELLPAIISPLCAQINTATIIHAVEKLHNRGRNRTNSLGGLMSKGKGKSKNNTEDLTLPGPHNGSSDILLL